VAALPPGLIDGVGKAARLDGVPAGELVAAGLPAGRITMEAAAAGAVLRFVALPVTVRLTAASDDAVIGTVTSAWNSRWAELESTVPRLHADEPLPLPQPKLKIGVPVPAEAVSWMLAADTVPPSAQAPTSHLAACPRSLLCCRGTTPTHRLAGAVVVVASNAVRTAAVLEALAEDVSVGADVVGADVVGAEVVGADVVGAEVVGAEVVGADVVGADVVGASVVGADVVGADVVGASVVGADVVGAEVVGAEVVGAAVVGAVVDGVEVADVPVADALGDEVVAAFSGSQDSAIPDVVAAVALLLNAATAPPEAAVSSALPAIKVIARRRPRAIRILTHIDWCHCASNHLT
jgi:hypothetical protein